MNNRPMKIFSGNASKDLTQKICDIIGTTPGDITVGKFSDGETFVTVNENVRGCDIYIVQSVCTPTNDNLMEVLVMIDAMKRASAHSITAVLPYYGYARQDRKARPRDPITAKLVADLLTVAGADHVLTMDLHAAQIQGYFDMPVDHLLGVPVLAQYFIDQNIEDLVVVSPDLGSAGRARQMVKILHDAPVAIIEKRRPRPNVSEVTSIIGDVEGKVCLLCDDMVDTAGTLCNGAEFLKKSGAKKVLACATHAVFSGPAVERLKNSVIDEVIVTDTIPLGGEKMFDKVRVVSVAKTFAEAILRINNNGSVSVLNA